MATKSIGKIKSIAEELHEVRTEIHTIEERQKEELAEKKKYRDELQQKLIDSLNGVGLKSIKTEGGDNYTVAVRKRFAFTNGEIGRMKFAKEHNCMTPDNRLLEQKLKKLSELPDYVQVEEVPYMSVRKAKKEEGTE